MTEHLESPLFERAEDTEAESIRAMYATAYSAGLPIISMDKCCQLLAWLYVFGGANEAVVFNVRFNSAVRYAQERLNIKGGERPNAGWLPVLQNYIREAEEDEKKRLEERAKNTAFYNEGYKSAPRWISDIEKTYNIETRV